MATPELAVSSAANGPAAINEAQLRAGRYLLASGAAGVLALLCLFGALIGRGVFADESAQRAGFIVAGFWDALFRGHDIAGIAQALLLIPPVFALCSLVPANDMRRVGPLAWLGAGAFALVALCLALVFLTRASDMLYMLPQGIAGLWLVLVNRLKPAGLGRGLRALGIVSGSGLFAVGISCVGVVIALGPELLSVIGPIPSKVDAGAEQGTLNVASHILMMAGSLAGVLTLPIWSILAGRTLRRSALRPVRPAPLLT